MISLGTAQFGKAYGISNKIGQPSKEEVSQILTLAQQSGIRDLDTAPVYGSEEILGNFSLSDFKITTKTSPDLNAIPEGVATSLGNLRLNRVYGLLLHDATVVLKPEGAKTFRVMSQLKSSGLVEKIGISIYTQDQIEAAMNLGDLDLIQVPINILDQRLLKSGILTRLKEAGVEIHARSAFLQGLLLMDENLLNPFFAPVAPILSKLKKDAENHGLTVLELALGYVLSLNEVDKVIVGVNSKNELSEITSAARKTQKMKTTFADIGKTINFENETILNPALWPKAAR